MPFGPMNYFNYSNNSVFVDAIQPNIFYGILDFKKLHRSFSTTQQLIKKALRLGAADLSSGVDVIQFA